MLKYLLLAAVVGPLGASAQGLSCESLRGEIEAKYRTGGIDPPVLTVVDATAAASRGRVVGTCERGSRKIIYTPTGSESSASLLGKVLNTIPPSPRKPEPIVTECKDGSVSVGGTCGRK